MLRELPRRHVVARYRLRDSGLSVFIRHGTADIATLDEVFYHGYYEPPPPVLERLAGLGRPPAILDLGANIGLFDAYILGLFPAARVTAVEADPANAQILRRCAEANRTTGDWRVVEAVGSNRDGTVAFAPGGYSLSRIAGPDEAGEPTKAVDVFRYLADADLLKMDFEGGEWEVLTDPRLAAAPAVALVLEYHPHLCPEADPRVAALRLLRRAGYECGPVRFVHGDSGTVWAWRPGAAQRAS